MIARRILLSFVALSFLLLGSLSQADAKKAVSTLASWNEGPTKQAVVAFVSRIVTPGSPDYLPPHMRIAIFDNDGTLLPEKPYVQIDFAVQKLRVMANADPSLMDKEPYKTALSNDISHMEKVGGPFLLDLLLTTHGDMAKTALAPQVKEFMTSAKHPLLNKPYAKLAYKPMLDLLQYLRENEFTPYICTGGMQDFVRGYSMDLYGIPPQNVIGTTFKTAFIEKDGRSMLWVNPEVDVYNDKKHKPVAIDLHTGIQPVITVGNVYTGGDIAMLSYGASSTPSLQLLLHHDDAARELAYDEANNASLTAAREQGWVVISMKKDWNVVFGEE